ncbi:MAG: VanW family protein [Firmicutes bacterium]|nr:VanW family protein [Bacillota bacterium]
MWEKSFQPAPILRPKRRSRLRLLCGRLYYAVKRRYDWHLSGKRFARNRGRPEDFPEVHSRHETPLLRPLAQVEMRLQRNKIINLKIAVAALDGLVLAPGETFSYWRLVGAPTRRRGFIEGMVLDHGRVRAGIGGGLCQLTNLIYWLTLHTPLQVVERWRHSYDVFPDAGRTLPFGSGATCAYPSQDLQIFNGTHQTFLLHLWLTDTTLAGEWRGQSPVTHRYEVYEASHAITQEPWGGYVRHNVLRRRVWDAQGNLVADEPLTENHALMMYRPFLPAPADGGHAKGG